MWFVYIRTTNIEGQARLCSMSRCDSSDSHSLFLQMVESDSNRLYSGRRRYSRKCPPKTLSVRHSQVTHQTQGFLFRVHPNLRLPNYVAYPTHLQRSYSRCHSHPSPEQWYNLGFDSMKSTCSIPIMSYCTPCLQASAD